MQIDSIIIQLFGSIREMCLIKTEYFVQYSLRIFGKPSSFIHILGYPCQMLDLWIRRGQGFLVIGRKWDSVGIPEIEFKNQQRQIFKVNYFSFSPFLLAWPWEKYDHYSFVVEEKRKKSTKDRKQFGKGFLQITSRTSISAFI